MNIQSIILLTIVLATFGIVLFRYIRRQQRHPNCSSCNCCSDDCSSCTNR